MRDPRTLGPYRPLPSLIDLLRGGLGDEPAPSAAPAMAQAAEPPPSIGQRIAGLAGGVGSVLSAPFRALGEARSLNMEQERLRNEGLALANQRAQQEAALADAQLPAQQALAGAQQQRTGYLLDKAAAVRTSDGALYESLLNQASGGAARPFGVEPGPAELMAQQAVFNMQDEETKQKLIAAREAQQARISAGYVSQHIQQEGAMRAHLLDLEQQNKLNAPPTAAQTNADRSFYATQKQQYTRETTKDREALQAVQNARKALAENSAVADIPAIMALLRTVAPGARVTQTEISGVSSATGADGRLAQFAQHVMNGKRLTPEMRAAGLSLMNQIEQTYQGSLDSKRTNAEAFLRHYGANDEAVSSTLGAPPKGESEQDVLAALRSGQIDRATARAKLEAIRAGAR